MVASSSRSLVDPNSSSSTTTIVQAVDVYALLKKKRYQSTLLALHRMYLCKNHLCLLEHHGLLDQLVQVAEDGDRTRNNSVCRSIREEESTAVQDSQGVSEGTEQEEDSDDDDDDDEDYEFEFTSEDEEEDGETEIQLERSNTMKEFEGHKSVYIDASTQTVGDLAHNFHLTKSTKQREMLSANH